MGRQIWCVQGFTHLDVRGLDDNELYSRSSGNLVYVSVLGQPVIIINSVKAAVDLLEKKSSSYSDRPQFQMAHLTGWDEVLICTEYGNTCRLQRKLLHRVIGSRVHMQNFHGLIENEVHAFTQRLMKNPEDKTELIKRYVLVCKRLLDVMLILC